MALCVKQYSKYVDVQNIPLNLIMFFLLPELYAMPAYSQNVEMASFVTMSNNESLSLGTIIGCVVAAFVMGKFAYIYR